MDDGDRGGDDGDRGTVVVMLVMVMSVVRIIVILMLLIMVTFDMSMGKVCFDKTIHSELCSSASNICRALAGLWGRRSPFTTKMCTCIDDDGRGDEDGDNPPPWSLY